MYELMGKQVSLLDSELKSREACNADYLKSLSVDDLLFNYRNEAGLISKRGLLTEILGGWEAPTCQIRGHFLGHWLSAAAMNCYWSDNYLLRAQIEESVKELGICQEVNGGRWLAGIPEKYLEFIAKGRPIWAPQYNIHKILMGLVDVYRYLRIDDALRLADNLANWFDEWSGGFDKETFADILDNETGGMLEVWADLLEFTKDEKYNRLLSRYYRTRLFDPLLEGRDVLTNMHANTTIPEVLGCARAYEVTGEERWLDIVKAYWSCAVDERGYFVTGGQTQGEVWTPKKKLKARLGDKNQEHCTVYNMMRLADFLFLQTGEMRYQQYKEYNFYNGVKAQTYWFSEDEKSGLISYFLPLKGASKKSWGSARDSFFCCHGTMVQANAALNRGIYYQDKDTIFVTQYIDSEVITNINGNTFVMCMQEEQMNGLLQESSVNDGIQRINEITSAFASKPNFKKYIIKIKKADRIDAKLVLRIPEWTTGETKMYVNGELFCGTDITEEQIIIRKDWRDGDEIVLILPIGLQAIPLPDDDEMIAFRYGPEVLAGLCDEERVLILEDKDPVKELCMDTERQWGKFLIRFKTETQNPAISFWRLNEIGDKKYQVYFKKIVK